MCIVGKGLLKVHYALLQIGNIAIRRSVFVVCLHLRTPTVGAYGSLSLIKASQPNRR